MIGWRVGIGAGLIFLIVLPLLFPFFESPPRNWLVPDPADLPRLGSLLLNSLILVAGVLALALPIGVALAVLLFRTNFPIRGPILLIVMLSLFLPVAVQVSAWQGLLGTL